MPEDKSCTTERDQTSSISLAAFLSDTAHPHSEPDAATPKVSPPTAPPGATPPFNSAPTWESIEDREVVLQVGERQFRTTYDTLKESPFFEALLSSRWNNARKDGSYFIDADPDLFQHILRYLRRGVFPLFYNRVTGHDYDRYNSLLAEARYFGIEKLEAWLKGYQYLRTLTQRSTAKELMLRQPEPAYTNAELEYSVHYVPVRVWLCPRHDPDHRGDREACERTCMHAWPTYNIPPSYEEEYMPRIVAVRKETIFDGASARNF